MVFAKEGSMISVAEVLNIVKSSVNKCIKKVIIYTLHNVMQILKMKNTKYLPKVDTLQNNYYN